jgi:hypothetical protein
MDGVIHTMKLLAIIFALLLATASPAQEIMGTGRRKVFTPATGPHSFAYIASSVTGCFNPNSDTKCVYALHANPSAGNLIFCMANWADSGSVTYTLVGSLSGTLTAIGSKQAGTGGNTGFSGQNYYKVATGGGTETITATMSATGSFNAFECAVYSFTGTLILDGTPQYSVTPASAGVASISGLIMAAANGMVGLTCNGVSDRCTGVGAGYTSRNDTNACQYQTGFACVGGGPFNYNTFTGGLLAEKLSATAGTQSGSFTTLSSASDVILGLVGF